MCGHCLTVRMTSGEVIVMSEREASLSSFTVLKCADDSRRPPSFLKRTI